MSSTTDLLNSIRASENGLTLAELLTAHPSMNVESYWAKIAVTKKSGATQAAVPA